MSATIILLRHGQTHWNREGRIQGHGDSPLTLAGIDQARAYGRTLAGLLGPGVDWRFVSSPLPRCLQTAAILCETAGLDFTRVARDGRLREVHTGDYMGRLKAEFQAGELTGQGRQAWFFNCPGGETHAHMSDRLAHWLADLAEDDHVVAVSHGIAGKILRGLYAGLDPDAALDQDSPQDALFRLSDGRIERIPCA